ncbi:MAG: cytidine deaminase [Clostridia bacterium]|nr:cytidine deaminase [Clostridia bacterium]
MTIDLQWACPVPGDLTDLQPMLERVALACFEAEGVRGAGFCVRIVDEDEIRSLNRDMRGIDRPTDVLSFPTVSYPAGRTARSCPKRLMREYDPGMGCANLGDCVINLKQARRQAEEYGHSLTRELAYLTAHSAFHLMGYDHMNEEDKANMRNMEERALESVGIAREAGVPSHDRLFELACEAMQNSYSPYSHFKVGACILTADGRTFKGCNFENASYGATICAERCAASCAIVAGARRFTAIAVVGSTAVAWPCGICRQVLREFSDADMPVIVGQYGKGYTVKTLGELLPEGLTPQDLGVDVNS